MNELSPIFDEVWIEEIPDQKEFRKSDLCPLLGWPDGVDPYPDRQLEDIVERHVYGFDYKFKGRIVSGQALKIGQTFKFSPFSREPISFTVVKTSTEHKPDVRLYIEAIYRYPRENVTILREMIQNRRKLR